MTASPERMREAEQLIESVRQAEAVFAVEFLSHYGYAAQTDTLADSVRTFRRKFGLPLSTRIDPQLITAMSLPRCGVPDYMAVAIEAVVAKWNLKELNWCIAEYLTSLPNSDQDELAIKAFDDWQQHSTLRFRKVTRMDDANIVVGTADLGGPGNVLAQAWLPQGDNRQLLIQMDRSEKWLKSLTPGERGIPYLNVVSHEAGHTFGLTHSGKRTALMYPTMNVSIPEPQKDDDVPRYQAIYGVVVPVPPTPIPPTPPTPGGPMDKYKPLIRWFWKFARGPLGDYVTKSFGAMAWAFIAGIIDGWLAGAITTDQLVTGLDSFNSFAVRLEAAQPERLFT